MFHVLVICLLLLFVFNQSDPSFYPFFALYTLQVSVVMVSLIPCGTADTPDLCQCLESEVMCVKYSRMSKKKMTDMLTPKGEMTTWE